MQCFSKPHEYAPLTTLREPHMVSTKVFMTLLRKLPQIDVGDSWWVGALLKDCDNVIKLQGQGSNEYPV